MMRQVDYQLTEADAVAGCRLQFIRALRSVRVIRPYLIGLALFAALGFFDFRGTDALFLQMAKMMLIWTATYGAMLLINYLLVPQRARRLFRQQPLASKSVTAEWSPKTIRFVSERGSHEYEWSDFFATAANRDVILLYQNEAIFNVVPKRVLSEGDASDIMQHAGIAQSS